MIRVNGKGHGPVCKSFSEKHNRSGMVAVLGPFEALPYYIHTSPSVGVRIGAWDMVLYNKNGSRVSTIWLLLTGQRHAPHTDSIEI
jgi:hypothetical protein